MHFNGGDFNHEMAPRPEADVNDASGDIIGAETSRHLDSGGGERL
jgi:hypothetical protein